MKINIKDHFEEIKQKHSDVVAKAKDKEVSIRKLIKESEAAKEKLEAEISKKDALQRQNEEEGFDVEKLKEKIGELKLQLPKLSDEIILLKNQLNGNAQDVNRSFEREDMFVRIITGVYKVTEAEVIDHLDGCIQFYQIKKITTDSTGRPIKCLINAGKDSHHDSSLSLDFEIEIKASESHFWKGYRPEALKWLPAVDSPEASAFRSNGHYDKNTWVNSQLADNQPSVFLEKKTGKFVLLATPLKWQQSKKIKDQNYPHTERLEYQNFEDAFADLATPIQLHLDALLENGKAKLDLDKDNSKNPLMNFVQKAIKELTSTKPIFAPSNETLPSSEIYKRIKNDWDALSSSPWTKNITGVLAKLKFYLENGERARFWCADFENHYGFRLRTRDHDWITGNFFIQHEEKQPEQNTNVEVLKDSSGCVTIKLGHMYLSCWISRE